MREGRCDCEEVGKEEGIGEGQRSEILKRKTDPLQEPTVGRQNTRDSWTIVEETVAVCSVLCMFCLSLFPFRAPVVRQIQDCSVLCMFCLSLSPFRAPVVRQIQDRSVLCMFCLSFSPFRAPVVRQIQDRSVLCMFCLSLFPFRAPVVRQIQDRSVLCMFCLSLSPFRAPVVQEWQIQDRTPLLHGDTCDLNMDSVVTTVPLT